MTAERRKAVLLLGITLIIGILIGSLVPSLYGRFQHRDGRKWKSENERKERPHQIKRDWVTRVIIRVTKPDSAQVKEIRPLTAQAATQIGALERSSNERMASIMDSLKLKLKPILTEEQNQRLEDFSKKARQRWKK